MMSWNARCAPGPADQCEDRQISQALAILGDFVAWLGFQRRDAATRPESRVNPGQPIYPTAAAGGGLEPPAAVNPAGADADQKHRVLYL